MALQIKADDVWQTTKTPYVKRNGVWTPAYEAWTKVDGAWTRIYEHDTTPSSPPELSLTIMQNRYIRVGARLPGVQHDTDLKRIRILAHRYEMPTTQFGVGFIQEEDVDWKNEPWSDWYYNGANPDKKAVEHTDTETFNYKQFPANPTADTNLKGGKHYYFAAWSEDLNGNWSVGNFSRIWMPKEGVQAEAVINKEARFQANEAGSAGLNGAGYTKGVVVARDNPRSNGLWFYGHKITDAMGEHGPITVNSAKIRVSRLNDSGQPTANVNLFWHDKTGGVADGTSLGLDDAARKNITKVGTINKGETKWFDIPASFHQYMNTQMKGLGLSYGIQASDFLEAAGVETDMRTGEVHVVWEEAR